MPFEILGGLGSTGDKGTRIVQERGRIPKKGGDLGGRSPKEGLGEGLDRVEATALNESHQEVEGGVEGTCTQGGSM